MQSKNPIHFIVAFVEHINKGQLDFRVAAVNTESRISVAFIFYLSGFVIGFLSRRK
jgi:hypothetical protein